LTSFFGRGYDVFMKPERSPLPWLALAVGLVPLIGRQNPPQDYGPWNRDLEWHESGDGLAFTKKGTFVERGGVPSLARTEDGRLVAAGEGRYLAVGTGPLRADARPGPPVFIKEAIIRRLEEGE
jgi:hypothetical protein